jgi:hypothetical protein
LRPIAPTIATLKKSQLAPSDRRKLFYGNTEKLLNMTL